MTRHGFLWLLAIVLIFLFAPLLNSEGDYDTCVKDELDTASAWYNGTSVRSIVDRANGMYSTILVKTGIDPLIRKHFVKPFHQRKLFPA